MRKTAQVARSVLTCVISVCIASSCIGAPGAAAAKLDLVFACRADNDLFRVITADGTSYPRYDAPAKAIQQAPQGAGVLILADGYPKDRTPVEAAMFKEAAAKKLRVYLEYPSMLPGVELGKPRYVKYGRYGSVLERTVVSSELFGQDLPKGRILVVQDCHVIPTPVVNPHMVLARVAGYDTAALGLPKEITPVLFDLPGRDVLVATTKLSHFVTGRYAPTRAWASVWRTILGRLQPGKTIAPLKWTPTVRPTFGRADKLPADAERRATRRAVEYYRRSRLLVDASGLHWDPGDNRGVKPLPADWKVGDGSHGILECYISKRIFQDGGQALNPCTRADCCLESAMGLACGAALLGDESSGKTAANLSDFVYFKSSLSQGPRADPKSPSYGLLGHNTYGPSPGQYYGDDNARCILSTIAAAALLESDRWDEAMLRCILGNFRTTGVTGFRPAVITDGALQAKGWKHYWQWRGRQFSPHYQSYIWATYLWLYDKTKFEPLRERALQGLRTTMEAYPAGWAAECGRMDEERIHMLLPLAWLVRVDNTAEHRKWLHQMVQYVLKTQHASGAVPQQVDRPYAANGQYGTSEAPITYRAGDPAADLLYTMNFAISGMHEAAVATGDPQYARVVDRMADFFIRVQTRSETHPELDGTWFRSFDFDKWEYWGSDGDAGWGVWTNEIGWTHSWITATLALRQMKTSLWDVSKDSKIAAGFDKVRRQMLPGDVLPLRVSLQAGSGGDKRSLRFVPALKDSVVRYTTDGSEPTAGSKPCVGPLTLATGATVKARAFDAGGNPASVLVVSSYWFLPPELRTADDRGERLVGRGIDGELELADPARFVDLGDLKLKAPATIAVWIKGTTLDGDQRFFSHLSGPANQAGSLRFDKRQLQVFDGKTNWQVLIGDGLEPNRWLHVAVVFRADGKVTGYLNGQARQTASSDCAFDAVNAAVGARWLGQWGKPYQGSIRDLRILRKALSPSEVAQLCR